MIHKVIETGNDLLQNNYITRLSVEDIRKLKLRTLRKASKGVRSAAAKIGMYPEEFVFDKSYSVSLHALRHMTIPSDIKRSDLGRMSWETRKELASMGCFLDVLKDDPEPIVAATVLRHHLFDISSLDFNKMKYNWAILREIAAKNGFFLKELVLDEDLSVAMAAVSHPDFNESIIPYHELKTTRHAGVLIMAARKGMFLDDLILSKDRRVSLAVFDNPKFNIRDITYDTLKKCSLIVKTEAQNNCVHLDKLIFDKSVAPLVCINPLFDIKTLSFNQVLEVGRPAIEKCLEDSVYLDELMNHPEGDTALKALARSEEDFLSWSWERMAKASPSIKIMAVRNNLFLNKFIFDNHHSVVSEVVKNPHFNPNDIDRDLLDIFLDSVDLKDLRKDFIKKIT